MKKLIGILVLVLVAASCDTSGVKTVNQPKPKLEANSKDSNLLDGEYPIVARKKLDNGLKIEWFEKGQELI